MARPGRLGARAFLLMASLLAVMTSLCVATSDPLASRCAPVCWEEEALSDQCLQDRCSALRAGSKRFRRCQNRCWDLVAPCRMMCIREAWDVLDTCDVACTEPSSSSGIPTSPTTTVAVAAGGGGEGGDATVAVSSLSTAGSTTHPDHQPQQYRPMPGDMGCRPDCFVHNMMLIKARELPPKQHWQAQQMSRASRPPSHPPRARRHI